MSYSVNKVVVASLMIILFCCEMFLPQEVCAKPKQTREQLLAAALKTGVYTVRKSDKLISLGAEMRIGWEQILLLNEEFLRQKYEAICHGNKNRQRGYYCNDGYSRPYGNTLQVGWKLKIPSQSVPIQIQDAVQHISGKSVALVIDDTGSMVNDRRNIGAFYTAAIRKYGKSLAGIWLYSDGQVRKYQAGGVEFHNYGGYENTYGALKEVAKAKPDVIVLITDERGDDWPQGGVRRNEFPPIVAHCLPEGSEYWCKAPLQALAATTGGQYIHHNPTTGQP